MELATIRTLAITSKEQQLRNMLLVANIIKYFALQVLMPT